MKLPIKRKKERTTPMSNNVKRNKICSACGEMARSNVQPKCKKCGAAFTKKGEYIPNRLKNAVFPIIPGRESKECDKNYTITVDFSPYPNLHDSLVSMAKEEIRRPEDQLLFLLKNELAEKEKAIG